MPGPLRFSRTDRAATAIVAVAVVLAVLVVLFHRGDVEAVRPPLSVQAREVRALALHEADTVRRLAGVKRPVVQLSPFDPNTADSVQLSRLGLSPFVAGNIMKYRRAGGVFRKPSDMERIYGLSREDYERIAPYVRIVRRDTPSVAAHTSAQSVHKLREGMTVDLNCGDTSQLQKVPGVGSVLARRIVKYGNLLGGYVSPEQVLEVYGIRPGAERWFRVDSATPRRINVNTATYGEMLRHPYFNKALVRAVLRRREVLGTLSNIRQMRFDSAFSTHDIERLEPYLDF